MPAKLFDAVHICLRCRRFKFSQPGRNLYTKAHFKFVQPHTFKRPCTVFSLLFLGTAHQLEAFSLALATFSLVLYNLKDNFDLRFFQCDQQASRDVIFPNNSNSERSKHPSLHSGFFIQIAELIFKEEEIKWQIRRLVWEDEKLGDLYF